MILTKKKFTTAVEELVIKENKLILTKISSNRKEIKLYRCHSIFLSRESFRT